MTLTTTTRLAIFSGNGVTTEFPFEFKVLQESDLQVQRIAADGTATTLTGGQYTVTLTDEGGEVTVSGAPLAAGEQLMVRRVVEPTQETSITNQQKFFSSVVEQTFDRLTMMVQQLTSDMARTLRARPDTSTSLTEFRMEPGRTLVFDAEGNPIPGPNAADVAGAQAQADAAIAARILAEAARDLAINAQQNLFDAFTDQWQTATEYEQGDLAREEGTTYIAQVAHTSGIFSTDLGDNKWAVFAARGATGPGTGDLLAAQNLADLADAATARSNLGLGSVATLAAVTEIDETPTDANIPTEKAVSDWIGLKPQIVAAAHFASAAVPEIVSSLNIASIARTSTGIYNVTLATPEPDTDYLFFGFAVGGDQGAWTTWLKLTSSEARRTDGFTLRSGYVSGTAAGDYNNVQNYPYNVFIVVRLP